MEERAGGSGSIAFFPSGEDFIVRPLFSFRNMKALSLQVEHGSIPSSKAHQFLMRSEFDHMPLLKNTDAIRLAHGREPVRDQDRGAVACGRQQPLEDLRFASNIELRGGFIEQHDTGARWTAASALASAIRCHWPPERSVPSL